jgi:hypothetical protein
MTPSYLLWKSEQATPTPPDRRADRPTEPHLLSGFWRIQAAKTKPDYPVAIWTEEGQSATIFQIGRKIMNTVEHAIEWDEFAAGSWLDCVAVTKADWSQALETKFWGDGKPSTRMTDEERLGIDIKPGDNNAPIEEALADQIAAAVEKAKATPEPTTQAEADAATGVVAKLRKLWKLADEARVVEKRPHDEAAAAVQTKWLAIMDPAKDEGAALDARRKAFLKKEQQRLDDIAAEENRKRQEEARRAQQAERERLQKEADERAAIEREQRRIAAEKAAEEARIAQEAAAADASKKAEADRLAAEAEAAEKAAAEEVVAEVVEVAEVAVETVTAERATAGTAYGRNSGLKKVKRGKIVDMAAFLAANVDNAEIKELAQKIANRLAKAGVTLPGMEITEVME